MQDEMPLVEVCQLPQWLQRSRGVLWPQWQGIWGGGIAFLILPHTVGKTIPPSLGLSRTLFHWNIYVHLMCSLLQDMFIHF